MTQNHRFTHRHQHAQNAGSQQRRFQYDPSRSRRQELERELRFLHRKLSDLDGQIDILFVQGQQLEADLQAHHGMIPAAIALEIGRAVTNALHVPFLPPAYRNWHYKRQALLTAQNRLKYRAIELKQRRDALEQQIGQIDIEIDLLRYS